MSSFVMGLGAASALAALHSIVGAVRYLGYARRASGPARGVPPLKRPEVLLVVPCCGDEDGLRSNLEALLGQEYERLHVRFVVAGPDDGAVSAIERACQRFPGRSTLVLAGAGRGHGQKVHNLLAALETGPLAEVLAFADSDGRPEPGWLARLVDELARPGVGVASTYRFYRPVPPGFSALLRSVWNLSVLALLGDHDRNFAWGGSMAIRREVFDRVRVREAWRGALSDDYALTHAVRRAGLRVAFVPEALVGSEGAQRFGSVLSWAARQISITRVYRPLLFWLAAGSSLCSAAFLALAPVVGGTLPLALMSAILALGMTAGGLRAVAVSRLAPQWRAEVRRLLWAYALIAPLAGLVTAAGVVRAIASRRIEWRGTRYEMRSPHETLVLGP
ncbi:MAG TPA: glycosyltransferase [Vicinamibacteria bacterium]|nr:glycosyltransferase [Vicinamibacteria bacterium]